MRPASRRAPHGLVRMGIWRDRTTLFRAAAKLGPAVRGLAAFFGVLALCTCALAQGGGWAAVQGIPAGSRIEVRLSPPAKVKGRLLSATASGLDVQGSHSSIRHLARARVAEVYLIGNAHKLRGALIGFGAGAAAGAVFGFATAIDGYAGDGPGGLPIHEDRRAEAAAAFGLIAGAIGAAIGAAIGLRRSRTLVFSRGSSSPAATLPATAS